MIGGDLVMESRIDLEALASVVQELLAGGERGLLDERRLRERAAAATALRHGR